MCLIIAVGKLKGVFLFAYFAKVWQINRKCDASSFALGETRVPPDEAAPTLSARAP